MVLVCGVGLWWWSCGVGDGGVGVVQCGGGGGGSVGDGGVGVAGEVWRRRWCCGGSIIAGGRGCGFCGFFF